MTWQQIEKHAGERGNARLRVVVSEHLSEAAVAWLEQHCEVVAVAHDDPRFGDVLREADGLIVRTYTQVDGRLLDGGPKLRVVGRAGAGLDNIDVRACRERGVEVVHTPDANTQAVVEYVVVLLADALRPRVVLGEAVDAAEWNRLRQETVATRQLSDLTLGILGLGRIGRGLAKAAAGLGMRVIYNDLVEIDQEQRFGAQPVPVEGLFEQADVISVHVDGREENRHFVDERLLGRMRSDAVLINTSRGFVVDSAALAEFLKAHSGALALLDVHEPEPFGQDYPLLGLPNARLYPHLASRTQRAMENMSWVVRDVVRVLKGEVEGCGDAAG